MITQATVPMPPRDLRELVARPEPDYFDNPNGDLVYPGLPVSTYEAVFDFGCGCGRVARLLLQQGHHRPKRYVGIDVHRGMLDWCVANITPVAPHFQFVHHDVWSPGYGRGNSARLAEPFPVEDGAFSLVIANSVFTHIYREQTEYYLHEVARILRRDGIAITTWFFFDNQSYPFFQNGVHTLFVNEIDPTAAVIYDRKWLLAAVRRAGLAVKLTEPPPVAGHQWQVYLERRRPDSVDRYPLGEEAAEWLCGATRKAIAATNATPEELGRLQVPNLIMPGQTAPAAGPPPPPPFVGPFAEWAAAQSQLATVQAELAQIKGSRAWKIARYLSEIGRATHKRLAAAYQLFRKLYKRHGK